MLTIFSVPKAFHDHTRIIQTNAIRSWTLLRPACEIILMGNDEGTAEISSELGLRHIPDVECNEYGTPLVNSIFEIAQDNASNPLVCYINADILMMSDLLPAVQQAQDGSSLLVGRRWDLDIREALDYSGDWESDLRKHLGESGRLHSPTGIDYFVFMNGFFGEIPPFALGRTSWDNWMIYRARIIKKTVVDMSPVVTAIHQNHTYAIKGGHAGAFKGPEAVRNRELLGDSFNAFTTRHATRILTPEGLKRAMTIPHILHNLDAVPVIHPRLRFLGIPKKVARAVYRAVRSVSG